MRVGVVGTSYELADVQLREQWARIAMEFRDLPVVVLATCSRIEVYFSREDVWAEVMRRLSMELKGVTRSLFGMDCFLHLAMVTAGLKSPQRGETAIQGQVKEAYRQAVCDLPSELHFLFQKSLRIGKKVRSRVRTGESLEKRVLRALDQQLSPPWQERRLLFVGASRTNCGVILGAKQAGARHITLCNRTWRRTRQLAAVLALGALPWEELTSWPHYDAVVVATKAPEPLLLGDHLGHATRVPLLIDLSVPRNVDPTLDRVINIDDLDAQLAPTAEQDPAIELVLTSVAQQLATYTRKQFGHLAPA